MREAHPIEQAVGMDYYVSDAEGTGGRLRASPEDFRVTELEAFDVQPVDADTGGYQHLVLRATLRGWDTNDFAGRLSDGLGISRERVSWAGTKDKRAVTTQLFSVDGVEPADLPEIADADVEVVGTAPDLGSAGNRLTVVQAHANAAGRGQVSAGLAWDESEGGPGLFYEAAGETDPETVAERV